MNLKAMIGELRRAENIIILLRQDVENQLDREKRIFALTADYERGEISEPLYLRTLHKIRTEGKMR